MAARGGARLQLQLHYNGVGESFLKQFKELWSNIGLGLGLLRAVAQGYNYSCSKIELARDFQKNLKSWGVTLGWDVDGCARWRKVTVTIAVT